MYWVFPIYWNYLDAWTLLKELFRFERLEKFKARFKKPIKGFDEAEQTEMETDVREFETDHPVWISKEEDPRLDPSRGGRDPTDEEGSRRLFKNFNNDERRIK